MEIYIIQATSKSAIASCALNQIKMKNNFDCLNVYFNLKLK